MTAPRLFFRSVWIGICALFMLAQTRLLTGLPLAPDWLDGFVLGSAVFAYNFTHSDRRVKWGAWLAGLMGAGCFFASLFQPVAAITWQPAVFVPAMLWLFYYGMRWPGNAGLRGVPAVKPFVVALAWAWVTVMLPLLSAEWGIAFGKRTAAIGAAGILLGRLAFIFALALAYDVADLAYDRLHGLTTLAGKLGVSGAFRWMVAALLTAGLCTCLNAFLNVYDWKTAMAMLTSLLLTAGWLWMIFKKTAVHDWQKVMIDALMPFQFFIIWLLKTAGN